MELADYCFKKSYNQYYKIFERPDWKDVLYADVPEEERDDYDENIVGNYVCWATAYRNFLCDTNRAQEANEVLKLRDEIIIRIEKDNNDGI